MELEPRPTDQNKQTQPTNQNTTSELEPISELNETIQQTNKENEETDTGEQIGKKNQRLHQQTKKIKCIQT